MSERLPLTGIYIDDIRECAQEVAEHIPTPWRAEYTDPSMSGNHWVLRSPGPGIRVSGHEYQHKYQIVEYFNKCGPDTIIKLCNEIEGLRRMLNAQK